MDSKIILAVLIVALIGIVAATYQTETNDVINTLSSVATEDNPTDSVTDIKDAEIESNNGQNNIKIDEDVVRPDNSAVSTSSSNNNRNPTSTSSSSSNSNNNNQASNNNNQAPNNQQSSSSSSNNQQNDASASNNQNSNQQNGNSNTNTQDNSQISQEKAMDIAQTNLPSQYSNAEINRATLNNDYYTVSFKENGEIIGEYEISAKTGKITGGAFKNEVPSPSEAIQQSSTNNNNNSGN